MTSTDTALVALTGNGTALTEVEAAILAELADDSNAFIMQPQRIKIGPSELPKPAFVYGTDMIPAFTAIVPISRIIRGWWPGKELGGPPLCSSPDGLRGVFAINFSDKVFQAAQEYARPHPGVIAVTEGNLLSSSYPCGICPMNQWDTGKGGAGKACKEMRRLLVFPEGSTIPAIMTLPPTSIKVWDAFCSSLKAKRSAYFAVRVRFELEQTVSKSNYKYSVVKVSDAGHLTAAEIAQMGELRRQYRELVEGMAVNADEYETVDAEGHAVNGEPTFHGPDGDGNENPF